MGMIETLSLSSSIQKWQENIFPAIKYNYMIWPAAAFINYKFVPVQHRIVYIR